MSHQNESQNRVCSFENCPTANHGETATCFTCNLESHLKCYNISKASMQAIGGACNIQFICDTCVANYKPIGAQVSTMMENMSKQVKTMYSAMAGFQTTLKSSMTQNQQQQDECQKQHQDHQAQCLQHWQQQQEQHQAYQKRQQHKQNEMNALLNGIHETLKVNAASSLVSDASFTKEFKDILTEVKASMSNKPAIGQCTSYKAEHHIIKCLQCSGSNE